MGWSKNTNFAGAGDARGGWLHRFGTRPVLSWFFAWMVYSIAVLLPICWVFGLSFSVDSVAIFGSPIEMQGGARWMVAAAYAASVGFFIWGLLGIRARRELFEASWGGPFACLIASVTCAFLPHLLDAGKFTCFFGCSRYPYLDSDILRRLAEARKHGWVTEAADLWQLSSAVFATLVFGGLLTFARGGKRWAYSIYIGCSVALLVAVPVALSAAGVRNTFWLAEVPVHAWRSVSDPLWADVASESELESLTIARIPTRLVGLPDGATENSVRTTGADLRDLRIESGEVVFAKPKTDGHPIPVDMAVTIDGKNYQWRVLLIQ